MLPVTPVQQRHNKVKVYFHETRITLSHYHNFMDLRHHRHISYNLSKVYFLCGLADI